jgi:hypothetical protein
MALLRAAAATNAVYLLRQQTGRVHAAHAPAAAITDILAALMLVVPGVAARAGRLLNTYIASIGSNAWVCRLICVASVLEQEQLHMDAAATVVAVEG